MRFPNLNISGYSVTGATVSIRDIMCEDDAAQTVECHEYVGNSWSESGTTTWSSVGSSPVGTLLSSLSVRYGQGNVSGEQHRYAFDITALAQKWANGTASPSKGVIFKATDSYESTGTNTYRTFASINRGSNPPILTVNYSSTTASISLNKSSASLYINDTLQLSATTTPSGSVVSWSSSDSAIASVSTSGLVTALVVGSATITATANGVSASCTVTVRKGSIVINKPTDSVLVGGTIQLTATTTPGGKTVTWSSSDTSVATVSSTGLVTFNRSGTVTVTASASGLTSQSVPLYGIVSDGVYTLKNAGSQMYVQMEGTHLFQSSDIAQVGSSGSTNVTMMWRFHYIGSGKYTIRSYANPTLALGDNADTLPENATTYFTSTTSETGFVNTQWYISDDGVGYILTNVQTGRILAVPVGNTTAGTQLIFKDSIESASGSSCRWFKGTISSIPTGIYLYIYNETTHQTTGFTASSTTMNIDDYRCIKGIYRNPNDISQQFSYGTSDNSTNVVIVNGGGGVTAYDFGKKTVSITHTSSGSIKSYTVWVRDYSDIDYDGISDSADGVNGSNNSFTEELTTKYSTSNVTYTVDYRKLFTGNTVYQPDLSTVSSLMSTIIYDNSSLKSGSNSRDIASWLSYHGMYGVKKVLIGNNSSDNHKSEIALGYKPVYYNGQGKLIITVVVRGTNGTLAEWSSNMDIGNTDDFADYPEWTTADNHMGFDITANRIMTEINAFVAQIYADHPGMTAYTPTYWVTGHSRGGAIANIVAAKLIDQGKSVYAYTFAAPNTTEASTANATKYDCIFNIINKDDFIPYFPKWDFTKYGRTARIRISSNSVLLSEWETRVGEEYMYVNAPTNPLLQLRLAAPTRNACYSINYNDGVVFNLEEWGSYPSNVTPYYVRSGDTIYQSPMFLMMYFAALAAGAKSGMDFATLNVAGYLEDTKWSLIEQVIGRDIIGETDIVTVYQLVSYAFSQDGTKRIAYPHYPDSYVILSIYGSMEDSFT